jgi:serralysin
VVSVTDVADYLAYSYWQVNGVAPAKWNISTITYKVTGLEPERAALARIAFQTWADVTGLMFTEITSDAAKIIVDDNTAGAAFEQSSYSGCFISSATINVSTDWYGGIDSIDSYALQTFIHEIGHALGLGHGGPYNGSATYGVDNVYANDSWHLSIHASIELNKVLERLARTRSRAPFGQSSGQHDRSHPARNYIEQCGQDMHAGPSAPS